VIRVNLALRQDPGVYPGFCVIAGYWCDWNHNDGGCFAPRDSAKWIGFKLNSLESRVFDMLDNSSYLGVLYVRLRPPLHLWRGAG